MTRLAGKVALITGGNSGIGLATAQRFVAEGARVFITGRRQKELDEAVALIGGQVAGIRGDVSNLDDLDSIYERISAQAGRLDILFANAGGGEFMPLRTITETHFDQTFATNVKGTLFTVQKALPLMGKGGSIILTGSTAAVSGTPAFSVYAASKAAVHSFARNWVNILAPGSTSTPGWHGLAPSEEVNKEMIRLVEAATPLGRLGAPDEIAAVALFLASDESGFVTGAEYFVDGGMAQI
jgi:NAD(P)-dependent dehydrogenase (short-subunit alcohol dehydrogenase family)